VSFASELQQHTKCTLSTTCNLAEGCPGFLLLFLLLVFLEKTAKVKEKWAKI